MKTSFIVFALLSSYAVLQAQTTAWESAFDNKADFLYSASSDEKFIIGTTKKDICVLDGKTGAKIWGGDFATLADVKSCESQYFMEDAGVLFLSDKKAGKDQILCLDIATGKLLWKADQYEGVRISSIVYFSNLKAFAIVTKTGLVAVDARSGVKLWEQKRFLGALADWEYLSSTNELVLLNYQAGWGAVFSGFQNQLMKINATSGEVLWETNYFGVVPTKYITGEIIGEMYVEGDRVFCLINGMQVFNLASGEKVWTAEYDVYDHKIGIGSDNFIYDGVSRPVVKGNEVYLVKVKHASKKVELEKRNLDNGEVLWTTQLESNPDAVPMLAVDQGKVILQLGGRVNMQGRDGNGGVFNNYKWVAPFKVEAYDAESGSFLWATDKLKDRITNLLVKNATVYVADAKSFYLLDLNNGSVLSELALNKLESGEAKELYAFDNTIGILGEKGFSMVNLTGSIQYEIKIKEPYHNTPYVGDNFLIMNDEEIRVFSLQSGKEKMLYKRDKGSRHHLGEDGSYILTISSKAVNKYVL